MSAGPLSDPWALQELVVKATPLALIAIGLTYCFRANLWNIGAEGQYVMGAALGGWLALRTHGTDAGSWVWPAMMLLGIAGGALYGLIPAMLRVRFGVSEILTSLMLVYVAQLMLDYLTRGPWRDPKGMNFPQSVTFDPSATLPPIFGAGRLHFGARVRARRDPRRRPSSSAARSSATACASPARRRARRASAASTRNARPLPPSRSRAASPALPA